jgi:hypothetical protein
MITDPGRILPPRPGGAAGPGGSGPAAGPGRPGPARVTEVANPAHLEHARKVADAVLYEGYLLYPYRHNAAKNRARFQFGVLMPPGYAALDSSERSASQTECLLDFPGTQVFVLARFLHLRRRTVQQAIGATGDAHGDLRDVDVLRVGGCEHVAWDEAAEREVTLSVPLDRVLRAGAELPFRFDGGEQAEDLYGPDGQRAGRLTWRWAPLEGAVLVQAENLPGPYGGLRLRVRLENRTQVGELPRNRDDALPHALIAAHTLIAVPGGRFLSMTDPPEWAVPEAAASVNEGTWPVLAGPVGCRDLVLSSPVILYDHPEVAPESVGPLYDATEIDEILALRTLALTDEEKRQARATDPKAAELMDRLDGLPAEMLERLHGAIRYLGPPGGARGQGQRHDPAPARGATAAPAGPVPWWDPGADTSVSPATDHVEINGVRVARGSRVRMRPGTRRADAQDLFLAGREAVVEAVLFDVDGATHLALTVTDDPAADLQRSHGRFLYFAPDEVEPVEPAGQPPGQGPAGHASPPGPAGHASAHPKEG